MFDGRSRVPRLVGTKRAAQTIPRFEGSDGVAPYAGLLQASDGALYGTTSDGVSGNNGTVFKILPDGSDFAILRNFSGGPDGYGPRAGLIQANDGALYGTNSSGGVNFGGTVFNYRSAFESVYRVK